MPTATDHQIITPKTYDYFLQLGLTSFHIAKAFRRPPYLDPEERAAIKTLGLAKFNLGCKAHTMNINDGWLNIEKFSNGRPGKFLKSTLFDDIAESVFLNFDLRHGIPADADSLNYVYHSLLIDVFEYERALTLFDDIYQALREGGKQRISTVNSAALLEALSRKDSDLANFCNDIYEERFPVVYSDIYQNFGSVFSNSLFNYDRKSLWDLDMLTDALCHIGFKNITARSLGEADDPEIRKIENSYHTARKKYCLFVECEK